MVFIHGLGGDPFATWRYDKDASWPHWLGEEFPDVGVWSLEYPASPSKWARIWGFLTGDRDAGYSMSLPDRAGQVLDRMVKKHLGERPVFFICHSLGGLLVKQILRKADDAINPRKKQVAEQTRAVLFLATPHAGAELASLLDSFRNVFGTTVSIDDLRLHDAHLRDLYDWYRNQSGVLGIQTETYYETRSVKGVLPIVNPTSAQPGVGADAVPLDEDHLSIAKPRERDAQVCDAARDLLNNCVLVPRPATPMQPQSAPIVAAAASEPQRVIVQVQSPSAGSGTVRIPCELPPKAKNHFGRLTELEQLADLLRAGENCAVVGPAGLGKTALAAEAVRAVIGGPAMLAASPFPDGVVFLDLYAYQGKAEPAWNNLANALAGPRFMESSSAQDRATEACRSRRALIIIEGGEEADAQEGRTSILELCRVFSLENRCLLLTRLSTQADPAESVELKEALHPDDAAELLDSLSKHRLTGAVREQVLALLEGHPLALTWAGGLLARDDDDPEQLVKEWEARGPGSLNDPRQAEHTLAWLFDRSVRGLDETERRLLQAAGLLARAPFPLAAMQAVLDSGVESAREALKSLVQRGLLRRSEEPGHWEFTHVLGYRFARKETGSDDALRERIGVWLSRHLRAVIADTASQHAVALTRALEHATALLRTDDGQKLWIPLTNDLLYDICDHLRDLGRLDLIGLALNGAGDWMARLPALTAQEPEWLRERSVLLNRQGDVLRDQGDLEGALAAFLESLAVMRRLAEADPSNAGWQRDLNVSSNKVGDVLRTQGDLAGALAVFRESLESRHLAEADLSNADLQRDLIVSHINVGDVLRDKGDLAGALAAFQESLALVRRLAGADPSTAGWQRDLSVSLNRVGEVLIDQGDLSGALTAFKESLAVMRRLAEADPSNAGWQRDLSVSLIKMGDVMRAQGDLSGALTAFQESLAVMRRLAEADPSNAVWQRDLSVGLNKLGDVLRFQDDLADSLAVFRQSLEVIRRLAESDSSNAVWQRDLIVSHNKVGDVLRDQDDLAGALATYTEGLAVTRRLAKTDQSNAVWQSDLSFILGRVAEVRKQQGNYAEALPLAEESLKVDELLAALDPTNASWQKNVAMSRALVAQLRGEETGSR